MPDDFERGPVKPAAGRTLGRYRLDALLGRGGMAEVFRATDTKLARTVAVKVILPGHAAEEHFLERFLREARLVASLEHPNILPVYDFGEEDGVPFLVMPYLPGGSLRDRLKAGPVPLAVSSSWIAQLSDALDAAHAAGVLHRDVKPANVLLGRDDRLFLADFGIAKMLESQTGLTATGVVVGTPIYMAPEQVQGHPASPATDRYSLAVVAFEILAGRPPFEGDSALSLMHQHVATPPPVLSARVAGLPPGLDRVLSKALAKDPSERHSTCRAFATGVASWAPGASAATLGLAGAGAGADTGASTAPTVHLSFTSEETALTGPRRGPRRAAIAAGAVAVLAGAWWLAFRPDGPENVPGPANVPAAAATTMTPVGPVAAPVPPSGPALPAPAAPPAAAVVESSPVPVPDPAKGEPLAKLLREEEGRIAQLEARVKAAEAAAALAASAAAAPARDVPEEFAGRLQAVRERLEPGRKETHRLSREDFQFAVDEAGAVLHRQPRNPDATYLATYGRGGLLYVEGNDPRAAELLVEAFTQLRQTPRRETRPIAGLLLRPDGSVGAPNAWELAIGYGDARGEAMGLLERELAANPRNQRALRARGMLRRMQGAEERPAGDGPRRFPRRQRPG